MLVLAAVPDVQFHKLRRAAGSRFNVAQVSTWDDVLTSIRGRPVELAVVDPLLSGQARSQEIERLRVLFPSLPLMLYTTLTPRTAGVLLALGQRGIQHAVFANYDDHPSRLREVLGQEEARSSSRQLLDQLGDALAPLPSELRWVLEEALRDRKSTRLNSSHLVISYAVFCLKKKKNHKKSMIGLHDALVSLSLEFG